MKFKTLINTIQVTHNALEVSAVKAVNISLTIRNWLIGFYIVEFEQHGEDRAKYGKQLVYNLANKLALKGLTAPELSRCRQFYNTYPEIFGLLTQKSKNPVLSDGLTIINSNVNQKRILGLATQKFKTADLDHALLVVQAISYTHLTELIKIEDITKRKFYELLILKTQLSVSELKRQINTLTYERLGLSANKELAFKKIQQKINPKSALDLVKSHYFFEFLNIHHPQLIEETDLEQALIGHLQEFILELGNGFCFEARQKRILIDDEYYFIDLVFYL